MDAKAIAQEVAHYYESQLDPFQSHTSNVQRILRSPVVALTHRVLFGSEQSLQGQRQKAQGGENNNNNNNNNNNKVAVTEAEEKKCCEKEEETENTATNNDNTISFLQDILKSKNENNKNDNDEVLLGLLGRRNKSRCEAFLTGVELAVPGISNVERATSTSTTTPTPIISSELSNVSSSSSSSSPPSPSNNNQKKQQQQQPLANTTTTTTTKNSNTTTTNKKPPEKSPVLTSLNNHGKAILRSVSAAEMAAKKKKKQKQPQMRNDELRIRLELYLRSLLRVRSLQQDCVVAYEPNKAVQARAQMIVAAFVSTVGCVRSMSPVLTRLITTLTKELLAVEYMGEELVRVIRRLVNEYEHSTSFASLAFLSSPEASAETRLTPMMIKYIRYLQSDWKSHEQACELERMLACSLDGNMRRYLKTVEFQSIGHLLEVCQDFRDELNNIELTPTSTSSMTNSNLCNDPEAVRQAIRDLQREVITVNGNVLPPVTSRKDLIHLLSQSLNSRSLTAAKNLNNFYDVGHPTTLIVNNNRKTNTDSHNDSQDNLSSLDGDDDNNNNSPGKTKKNPNEKSPKGKNYHASFHLSTVDLLTRRLLIAASRTGTGGDAYFIVRDLFGDEDVEVVPAKVLPHHVRASRVGSIEIQVRLSSVTIKCHGSFDIYPKSLVGCCEPLIQLHTTSSETIYLQELRSCDSSSEGGGHCLEDDGSRSSDGMENLVLQEKQTNKTGKRMLSIRPALYEKVQVWNTPS